MMEQLLSYKCIEGEEYEYRLFNFAFLYSWHNSS